MNNRRTFLAITGLAPLALAGGDKPMDIFEAAASGNVDRINELAKINPAVAKLRSAEGKTALHYATEAGQPAVLMPLQMLGADLNAGPETPLIAAVAYPDHAKAMEMSQTLLINGADPNARRRDGGSAIELAEERGYKDVVALLRHRADEVYFGKRYAFDAEGRTYVRPDLDGLPQDFINDFARLAHFDVERVKKMVKLSPALVHGRATWDESGIEAAAHMGLYDLARHIADHGAAVSTCTATLLGLGDRVQALVGSDSACLRERGAHDIPLMAYTAYGREQASIAEFLLKAGARVDDRALGVTTLHLAAKQGYVELAEVLIVHGADVNAVGRGVTPLAMAVQAKRDRVAELLRARGGRE
jgi:ankyrin repeat protein